MTTQIMLIENEAQYEEKKKGILNASQMSALYKLEPESYSSLYERWLITRGKITEANVKESYYVFGKILEPAICEMIKYEHPTWSISTFPYFAYDEDDKIGSRFSRIVYIEDKMFLLDIKSITHAQYKKKFTEHAKDDIEAPTHDEIKMQVDLEMIKDLKFKLTPQSELQAYDGIVMAVFILDTRELRYIFRKHDAEMCTELRKAAVEFWAMETPPEPDYARDTALIAKFCPQLEIGKELDATKDNHFEMLASQYRKSKDIVTQEEKNAKAAYGELLTLVKDYQYVWTKDFKISVSNPPTGKRLNIKSTIEEGDK